MNHQIRQCVLSAFAAATALLAPVACSSSGRSGEAGRTERTGQALPSASVVGSGVANVDVRAERSFRALRIEGSIETYVTVGPAWNVSVTCDDNLATYIGTRVEGDVLIVSERRNIMPRVRCSVDIAMPVLVALDVVGSAHTAIAGRAQGLLRVMSDGSGNLSIADVAGTKLHVVSTGSGNIRVDRLTEATLEIDVEGTGGLRAAGSATDVVVRAGGSGGITLDEVAAERVEVTSTGSGNVAVRASRNVRVRVGSSGNVSVAGRPATRDASSTGSGNITFE